MSQRARSGSGGVTGHRGCPVQRLIVAAVLTLVSVVPVSAAGPPEVDFAREVQPLLARRCYSCHGPDTREAGLRLDDRAAATARLESGGRAIVPGEPAGQARTGQARTGQARTGQARTGQARTGQARTGQARTGQARTVVGRLSCRCMKEVPPIRKMLLHNRLSVVSTGFSAARIGAHGRLRYRVRHGGRPLLPRSHGT
jgi:hypothetical protein